MVLAFRLRSYFTNADEDNTLLDAVRVASIESMTQRQGEHGRWLAIVLHHQPHIMACPMTRGPYAASHHR